LSAPVTVTFFANYAATTKCEERIGLAALAQRIRTTTAVDKHALPWLKLARFGDRRTDAGSLRHNANVRAITGIEADYDGEQEGIDKAERLLRDAGIYSLIYTSPSHTEDAPRWRVLCPLSVEHPPEARDRLMARLNGLFGGIFSRESWTLSQSYYYGSVERNPSHRVTLVEGVCIDLADHLDATAIGKPEEPARGVPPAPASRPEEITDSRLRGLFASLLDNIRAAEDGQKHFVLWRNGKTLGGHLHHAACPWGEAEAIEQLVGALPMSVKDWVGARRTAADAIRAGTQQPLDLEERPRQAPTQQRQEHVARLWDDCVPLPGTVAAIYLETIGLGHLIDCPEMRFGADCHHPSGLHLPALVAAVRAIGGTLTGMLRIYLLSAGSGLADVEPQRAPLGQIQGGAIRLSPIEGVTGAGELVIAVDIEEAASLGLLMQRPAWATATPANLAAGVVLPSEVGRVAVVTVGSDGAARSVWFRLKREGRVVQVATPPGDAASYSEILKNMTTRRNAA
jgi:hypothetical protein